MTAEVRKTIDWAAIKERLAKAEEALTRGYATAPEERRATLEARARSLAQQAPAAGRGEGFDLVEFELGPMHLGLPSGCVTEVRTLHELTPVPCTPPFVSGIMAAHGRIIAVVDLKKYLALPESGLTDLNKVIILQHGDMEFGVLADRIVGGRWLAQADLGAGPDDIEPRLRSCLKGQGPHGLMVLDVDALVRAPGFVIEEEVAP
jgi:purine-binding chemotaxis protein CheW